ncbi:uncharacterized protein SOCE26_051500 [Sorangium cellulosum]|uniref:Uncharacterized protein n=1 Tax=Sorangium cellulosum TaxID=56 RepID=A0A2L0EWM6_SORCE|nr:hypothetical protein [Sorangium cellulosum]AUX43697.1 uncharacterized protein SOCE26_051500 [Sorangium cellulosum]
MIELLNSRLMRVAMVMATLTAGCAVGEDGVDDLDMEDADAVEVEETSQALYGNSPFSSRWGGGNQGWGFGSPFSGIAPGSNCSPSCWKPPIGNFGPFGNYGCSGGFNPGSYGGFGGPGFGGPGFGGPGFGGPGCGGGGGWRQPCGRPSVGCRPW